jgi:hypothetical protein
MRGAGKGFAGFVLGALVGVAVGAWFGSGGTLFSPKPKAVEAAASPADAPIAPQKAPAPVVASATPAVAASAPASVPVQTKFVMPAPGKPVTIGVFGDSMADGLWAGLYREVRDGKSYDVVRFSQPSTGISRYDYVDIQEKTADQLASRHVDIAVVLFGTNDEQGILDGRNVYAFNTPGWRAAYETRINNLVNLFRQQGTQVYWVGLPKMGRSDSFDERAQLLNTIFAQRMAALGVPFISTVAVTSDEKGEYDAYLPGDKGRRQLMRARDGIHMTMAGYMRMASPVAARIRADVTAAMPQTGAGKGR